MIIALGVLLRSCFSRRFSIQRADDNSESKPERCRSDADHIRFRRSQLLRRFAEQAGRRYRSDIRCDDQRGFQGQHTGTQRSRSFRKIFFSYGFMVYLAVVLAILLSWYMNRTRQGLSLRSVGENPASGTTQQDLNVIKYKYLATCFGAGISGLGGLFYVMDYTKGTWANDGTIEALGWLACSAPAIFATWTAAEQHMGFISVRHTVLGIFLHQAGARKLPRSCSRCCRMLLR